MSHFASADQDRSPNAQLRASRASERTGADYSRHTLSDRRVSFFVYVLMTSERSLSFSSPESYLVSGCDRSYLTRNRLDDRALVLATIRVLTISTCSFCFLCVTRTRLFSDNSLSLSSMSIIRNVSIFICNLKILKLQKILGRVII